MEKKTLAILILAISAILLAAANFISPTAKADNVIGNRDYQVVTATIQAGGEGLYILDNRTGQMAIFTFDQNQRTLLPRAVRPMSDVFHP